MIFEKRIQYIKRYREIAVAFSRSGFHFIVEELGLDQILSIPRKLLLKQQKSDVEGKTRGERIRLFIEEMGPTFVKLGQIASTRPDLVPVDILKELEKLQSHVPPFPYEDAVNIIEESLDARLDDVFQTLDAEPLGSASIGQVHKGKLVTGETVAVKVQRPNIESTVRNDLEILHRLAALAERQTSWAQQYQLVGMIEEFSIAILNELDYTIEGRNADKIARQFEDDDNIKIPKIYWDASTRNVLSMEFISGVPINDFEGIETHGYSREVLAERLTNAVFHQILIEGFFHGDPHPGNINILEDETIALMDFGMVGSLTQDMKSNFGFLILSMMRSDASGVVRAVTHMGAVPDDVNMKRLRKDTEILRDKYYDVPLSQLNLGEAVQDLFNVANKHHIKLPSDFTLLGKTILTLESIVSQLDPEFSIVDVAEPFGRQLIRERYNPKNMANRLWGGWNDFTDDFSSFSDNVHEFSKGLKDRQVPILMELKRSETYLKRLDRIGNRLSFSIVLLSFSIILVGLIIGTAISGQTTVLWSLPAIEFGSAVALLLFMGMIYAILRSGRF